MVKKISSILLFISLKLYCSENTQPLETVHSEESVIAEFKTILKEGSVPEVSIRHWIKNRFPVLLRSPKEKVKQAGELLEKVDSGEILSINGAQAVPTIIGAVKEHHNDFSLSWYESARALVKGTQWFISGGDSNAK